VFQIGRYGENGCYFFFVEHHRQRSGRLRIRDPFHCPWALQRYLIDELQGAVTLRKGCIGDMLLIEQMEEILLYLLLSQLVGELVKVPGKSGDLKDVCLLGPGA